MNAGKLYIHMYIHIIGCFYCSYLAVNQHITGLNVGLS